MAKLKCHQINCVHNHDIHCGLEEIHVSEEALCHSYEKRDDVIEFDKEFAKELAFTFTSRETCVDCNDCECLNNEHRNCRLNNLRIDEVDGYPKCVNYRHH